MRDRKFRRGSNFKLPEPVQVGPNEELVAVHYGGRLQPVTVEIRNSRGDKPRSETKFADYIRSQRIWKQVEEMRNQV